MLKKLKQHNPHHPLAKNQTAEKTEKKKKMLRATREKCIYRGQQLKRLQIFHQIPCGSKSKRRNLFKCGKKRINVLYPAKNEPSGMEGVRETFPDEQHTEEVRTEALCF